MVAGGLEDRDEGVVGGAWEFVDDAGRGSAGAGEAGELGGEGGIAGDGGGGLGEGVAGAAEAGAKAGDAGATGVWIEECEAGVEGDGWAADGLVGEVGGGDVGVDGDGEGSTGFADEIATAGDGEMAVGVESDAAHVIDFHADGGSDFYVGERDVGDGLVGEAEDDSAVGAGGGGGAGGSDVGEMDVGENGGEGIGSGAGVGGGVGGEIVEAIVVVGVDHDGVGNVGHRDVGVGDVLDEATVAFTGFEAEAVGGAVEGDVVDGEAVEAGLGLATDGDAMAGEDEAVFDVDV